MIYFDNAATTYPKPPRVIRAVNEAMKKYGGNPGRSGHDMSLNTAAAVFSVRERAGKMFGAQPENVIFTSNCSHSLNIAIKGIAEKDLRMGKDVHVIISDHEHNSVFRPVHELTKRGLSYSIARLCENEDDTAAAFESLITPRTKAIICTLGSNVTGQLMPVRRIGEICRRRGLIFIADGAQTCGVIPYDLERDGINILCMPGHKGIYGITGTGMLITDGKFPVYHLMEGGTGSTSADPEQSPFLPDALESGTVNTVGIISMGAGMDFISRIGHEKIYAHESSLCSMFINGISDLPRVRIYRKRDAEYLPIVLFNIEGMTPENTAAYLNDNGFALRGGLHCSPLAHNANGTMPDGAVRFAPSVFSTPIETARLINAVRKI